MAKTKIEWADYTVNPIRVKGGKVWPHGYHCTKISPGCKNCYAERMNIARGTGLPFTKRDVQPYLDLSVFDNLPKKKPCRVFVQDMSDLFHETVPFEMIGQVYDKIVELSIKRNHHFLQLTKRPDRMLAFYNWRSYCSWYPQHMILGVTVCNQKELWKIDTLRQIPAALKFISFEPLLEDVGKLDLSGIGWGVIGCESGPKLRMCEHLWMKKILDQFKAAEIPCFIKQILINGKVSHDMNEWPEDLRFRQSPGEE